MSAHTTRANAVPSTQPTITSSGGTVSGVVALSASSTAAQVTFLVSGVSVGSASVTNGTATLNWPTWGYANGNASVTAEDCDAATACGSQSNAVAVDIENQGPPTITSPTDGQTITGGFTMNATAPSGFGGAIGFLIDGVMHGFDATAPYSVEYTGSALSEGSHTAAVVECSSDGTLCNGPSSDPVTFTSNSLHPSITSISPNPFSPNHDGNRDQAVVTFSLPDTENVSVEILHGTAVARASLSLGSLPAGAHSWTWTGTNSAGVRYGDGTYTAEIDSSAVVNGAIVRGQARRDVVIDTTAPTMTSVTGNGWTFYSYPDGYQDNFTPGVTLNEPAVLGMIVRTTQGALVQTISASKRAGRTSLSWNGKNRSGARVAAGQYKWDYVAIDGVGNKRVGPTYTTYVSLKRLIAKSATFIKAGASNDHAYYHDDGSCLSASKAYSSYASGIWLANVCDPDFDSWQDVWATYHFGIPGAVKYGDMGLAVKGSTMYPPSALMGGFEASSGDYDVPTMVNANSLSTAWTSLGKEPVAGHVNSAHVVNVLVDLDDYNNSGGSYSDYDIANVRLAVSYYVLG
jgi:flagellar hook assembly protein FlgD